MTRLRSIVAVVLSVLIPLVASAAVAAPTNLREFARLVVRIFQNITGILFTALAVGLIYGIVRYFISEDNERVRHEIKEYLLWCVIGIIVVMGLWGILSILGATFFGSGMIGIPEISPPTN